MPQSSAVLGAGACDVAGFTRTYRPASKQVRQPIVAIMATHTDTCSRGTTMTRLNNSPIYTIYYSLLVINFNYYSFYGHVFHKKYNCNSSYDNVCFVYVSVIITTPIILSMDSLRNICLTSLFIDIK